MDISDRTQPPGWRHFPDDQGAVPIAREVAADLVADPPASPGSGARIGLFWALPISRQAWDIVAVSRPFDDVPEIGGFRTLEAGHVDLWSRVRREAGQEVIGEYEDYPRGRVNWREDDQRFLLLLDPTLCRPSWVARVMARFALPVTSTLVMTDPHYRAKRKPPIEAPQVETGEH